MDKLDLSKPLTKRLYTKYYVCMIHQNHEMNKSYPTATTWTLFAVSNGDIRPTLISSRDFCKIP
jgi:hypothetical protein